jgi:uncharacterized membrane protein
MEEVAPYSRANPRHALARFGWGAAAGVACGLLASLQHGWAVSVVAGWDAGALTLILLAWRVIWTSDVRRTRQRAASADFGRNAIWALVLLASCFSLFAGIVVLRLARTIEPGGGALLYALSMVAVVVAWTLTHTSYTLRYAHLYYHDDKEGEGGLTFPGDRKPDDLDFAYFSFTIGMCFQVSDVVITSRQIRRAALGHAILSFAYNTVILALALNLFFGVLS